MINNSDMLEFYANPGAMTDAGGQAKLLDGLPTDIPALCQIVQQNLVHVFWAKHYGRSLSEAEKAPLNIRPVVGKLDLICQVDGRPLSMSRPLEQRQVGNCRDFSLMLTAILRHQGRPARARCGFATYFIPDHFEDHWVVEYWNTEQERWVLVDAQLDDFQRKALGIDFNTVDTPRDRFIVAGQAWRMCREGQKRPEQFGIFDMNGWWFIWGNVVRDFLSLNKVEILPWDYEVGFFSHRLEDPFPQDPSEVALYDRIAALTVAGDEAFQETRQFYCKDNRWRVPESWGV
jgi:Transglutaminase-like superfamily